MMKFYYIIILAICLSACGGSSNEVNIKGEIKGLTHDRIYLYGNDELSDMTDTIHVVNGKISHTMQVDTSLHVMMILNENQEYPLYLERNKTINIQGDLDQSPFLDIKGVELNEQLTAFNKSIAGLSTQPNDTTIISKVEEFIRTNQTSLVSIYLLDKYFVQKAEPDFTKIRELISYMDGTLQDKPYIQKLNSVLEEAANAEPGKPVIAFSLPNAKGETINRNKYRNKFLLINFWASWCDSCQTAQGELRTIHKKYKDHPKFAMLGISMDIDRQEWKNAIKADTLNWEQVCDFTGLDNTAMKQYGVYNIPYNILLNTDGRILERDIKGEALTNKLEELLKDK